MSNVPEPGPLLTVRHLRKVFERKSLFRSSRLEAVKGVDLAVGRNESVGLVGESGSGKTTTARCILRLTNPSEGEIVFDGTDVAGLPRRRVRHLYRHMQMVFQDPNSSLNPRMRVREIVCEPLRLHLSMTREEREKRALELMEMVGLSRIHLDRYPNQLSGGQRQRVGIGRAIATHPMLVFLDEPTSSLDVSVRGQVMQLLRDLQREMGMAYVLISHDLGVVRQLCDRVLVMYNGSVVEHGATQQIFEAPEDEYTKRLLAAIPSMDGYRRRQTGALS